MRQVCRTDLSQEGPAIKASALFGGDWKKDLWERGIYHN